MKNFIGFAESYLGARQIQVQRQGDRLGWRAKAGRAHFQVGLFAHDDARRVECLALFDDPVPEHFAAPVLDLIARLNYELTPATLLLNPFDRRVGARTVIPFGLMPEHADVLDRLIAATLHTMELAHAMIDELIDQDYRADEIMQRWRDQVADGKVALAAGEPPPWAGDQWVDGPF